MNKAKKTLFLILVTLALITLIAYAYESLFSPYVDLPVNGKIEDEGFYTWGHLVILRIINP
jgi:hypothetical protein